jgi:dTDP-4-dehydrorhamnose 3,5-epimerase
MHAMKASESSYDGFGEAYFSSVEKGAIKGWKRHTRMTLNLIVPIGAVEFVIHNPALVGDERFRSFKIGAAENYARLTVPPGLWMAFSGLVDGPNLVLNVASIGHDPTEIDRASLDAFPWAFGQSYA